MKDREGWVGLGRLGWLGKQRKRESVYVWKKKGVFFVFFFWRMDIWVGEIRQCDGLMVFGFFVACWGVGELPTYLG